MIQYRDFVPAREKGGFLRADRFAPFGDAVAAANDWITQEEVDVVTIETVVLPNIFASGEQGTGDADLQTVETNVSSNTWHQFVRVWYRAAEARVE